MSRRILVVDDDASLGLTLSLLLRARGFEVDQAASAEEALVKLAAGRFEAVVSDVRMGRMSGVDLAVRAKARWPALRIVLMSGFCHMEDLLEADVDGFVEKPPDLEHLVAMLRPEGAPALAP